MGADGPRLDIQDLAERVLAARGDRGVFVVGLTGGVAAGKTTLATALAAALRAGPAGLRVEQVNTDGFLRPNRELEAVGLLNRKGYPETYDKDALSAALGAARRQPTGFPGYSHRVYDVDPALSRVIDPPDVLIVEGLGLDRATPLDLLIYLDADEADQEAWFIHRFLGFWEQALTDETSFYARFRHLHREAAAGVGAMVWRAINRPNLREHIQPVRALADLVVVKGPGHAIVSIASGHFAGPVQGDFRVPRSGGG
jgi:type I pantothenate kinase